MIFSHNDLLALLGENGCRSILGLEGSVWEKTALQLYSVCSTSQPLKNTTLGIMGPFSFHVELVSVKKALLY